ncbi:TSR3, partial [Symbiodinium sp. KB8]
LKLTKDQRLDPNEEVLSVEIARFVGTLVQAVPRFANSSFRFPDQPEIQRMCIEKCLDWLVPAATVRVFVAMILYELQLDIGGGSGRSIHHEFVKDAYKRVGMKDQALAALTHILVRCTDYRYDVLEVFSVGEVFLAQNVRPSFLGEMLNGLNLGAFTLYVETFLADYDPLTKDQQVLHMEIVEMQSHTSNNFSIYLLVATNFKVFLLEPNPEKPAYAAEIGERWDPNWETLFPRQPLVVWEREYSSLVRIWRCYGSQKLVTKTVEVGENRSQAMWPSDQQVTWT